jgi:hypothetical protein
MGIFSGGSYRVRVRQADDEQVSLFVDDKADAAQLVANVRAGGAKGAAVDYVMFVPAEDGSGSELSFGDYWGDGEDA